MTVLQYILFSKLRSGSKNRFLDSCVILDIFSALTACAVASFILKLNDPVSVGHIIQECMHSFPKEISIVRFNPVF